MVTYGSNTRRRFPAPVVLGLLTLLAAVLVFSSAPPVHGQQTVTVAFGAGVTIPGKSYTAGAAVPMVLPPAHTPEWEALQLPEVTVTPPASHVYTVTYSVTGLPDGLEMGSDRIIRGTPESATTSAATVTYTASVDTYDASVGQDGRAAGTAGPTGSASLTFTVTVSAPVTFNAEAMTFFNTRIITWISGQGWRDREADGTITFPAAAGGTGDLKYHLVDNSSAQPLSDVATGITFNTTTRKLGGTPGTAARKQWAVTYVAEDGNGGQAFGHTTIYAGGYGGL